MFRSSIRRNRHGFGTTDDTDCPDLRGWLLFGITMPARVIVSEAKPSALSDQRAIANRDCFASLAMTCTNILDLNSSAHSLRSSRLCVSVFSLLLFIRAQPYDPWSGIFLATPLATGSVSRLTRGDFPDIRVSESRGSAPIPK
jgi:hypothetical protein